MPEDDSYTGRMLGRYRLLEKVGQGGMGVVYRAEDTRLNREVAIKLIHPNLLQDPDIRRRFLREAQAASAITHANVCIIHSIEEEEGQLFLVLEYLQGATLKEKTPELRGNLKALLDLVIQGAEGLAEAHRLGVVHRDIKSANIWVTQRGVVKIMDFGLAKQIGAKPAADAGLTADFTDPGITIGTTHYMSPEQARGREVDPRSDIFSFGAVLYEVSTGKLPFQGTSTVDILDQILNHDPAPPSHLNPELPPEFDRIVMKTLRKDPQERYQTAADLVVDLKALRREMDTGPRTPVPGTVPAVAGSSAAIPAAGPPAPPPSTLRSALLILAAVIVVVGLTLGAVLLVSRRQPATQAPAPSGRPTVAVLAFDNRTGDERLNWYGTGAAELLAVELARLPNLDVISKQRVYDTLKQMRMKEKIPTLEAGVATEVARKSGATMMVRGDTLMLSGSIILKAEAVEVSTGRVLAAERVTGVTEQNMLGKVDELSRLIGEKLKAVK